MLLRFFAAVLMIASITNGFAPPVSRRRAFQKAASLSADVEDKSSLSNDEDLSRRGFIDSVLAVSLAVSNSASRPAFAADIAVPVSEPKVLVLGGTGFVGTRVVDILKSQGVAVVSTSTDGRNGTKAFNVITETDIPGKIQSLAAGCTAVISCVGAIGTQDDERVNAATGLAAAGAKGAGVKRFVYITVAPEVAEFAKGVDFLQPYLRGKQFSRASVLESFGDAAVFIEPTFIYGGGSFELNPPRVASFYGQFIEGLLSSGPVRSIERILSPGIVKIALEPPVAVDTVASAAVAGALGKSTMQALDSYDKIKQAAELI